MYNCSPILTNKVLGSDGLCLPLESGDTCTTVGGDVNC